jgi:hypothetical protein
MHWSWASTCGGYFIMKLSLYLEICDRNFMYDVYWRVICLNVDIFKLCVLYCALSIKRRFDHMYLSYCEVFRGQN